MKLRIASAAFALGLMSSGAALAADDEEADASPETKALAECVVQRATTREQGSFMQLSMVAAALTPTAKLAGVAPPPPQKMEEVQARAISAVEHLFLDICRKEVVAAVRADGTEAVTWAAEELAGSALTATWDEVAGAEVMGDLPKRFDEKRWLELKREIEAAK